MASYTYEECLERSYRVNWKIKDVLGFADFDLERPWLPEALSCGSGLPWLGPQEQLRLTHVEMGAYAHLFGFVEAFIAPEMVNLANSAGFESGPAFAALTNFASEEIKHMHLFREVRRKVDEKIGFPLELLQGEMAVAEVVLGMHPGAVLLLTSAIEWLTQDHFLNAMRDVDNLDGLTREVFKFHWMEEAQHARLDHLETLRVFRDLTPEGRDEAIRDLVRLLAALDALLQEQVDLDARNAARYLGRAFTHGQQEELLAALLRAKRHCFIECGVNHPNFLELFKLVSTPAQRDRVQEALGLLLQPV